MKADEQLASFEAQRKGLNYRRWPREDILEHSRLLMLAIESAPARLMPGQRAAEPERWQGWRGDRLPLDEEIYRQQQTNNQERKNYDA